MPYSKLPERSFWKLCRETDNFRLDEIYTPGFELLPGMRIATAGSCFAQNIGRYIRNSDLNLVDTEPPPKLMPPEVASRYGFGLFSARYGNIYTARQLRQLLQDAQTGTIHDEAVWQTGNRYFDGLRPNVEPHGFASKSELLAHRIDHLARVRKIFSQTDVFIFTLGLTEAWENRETGLVFPTAPGVVAGQFDERQHRFLNLGLGETLEDLTEAILLMRTMAPNLKILLTVSPVPLTATASGDHVLSATTYSKSVLRAVAGELASQDSAIDYFPSYEIITGTPFREAFYKDNMREVSAPGVAAVMSTFFTAHPALSTMVSGEVPDVVQLYEEAADDLVCEEALLEAFALR